MPKAALYLLIIVFDYDDDDDDNNERWRRRLPTICKAPKAVLIMMFFLSLAFVELPRRDCTTLVAEIPTASAFDCENVLGMPNLAPEPAVVKCENVLGRRSGRGKIAPDNAFRAGPILCFC